MAYRATRDENRVGVVNWTADLRKGQIVNPPKEVAEYLVEHDLLVECDDKAEDNPWYDSEDKELSGDEATTTENIHGPVSKPHNMSSTPANDIESANKPAPKSTAKSETKT